MSRAPTNTNKTRVCLHIDDNIVAYFKHVAETNEVPYQPLMNKVLREWFANLPEEAKMVNQGD